MSTRQKILLLMLVVLVFLSGCGIANKGNTSPSNTGSTSSEAVKTKLVHIDSDPQEAVVFIDDKLTVMTPSDVELTLGQHFITFGKYGYQGCILEDAEVKEDTTEIKVKLEKIVDENIIRLVKDSLSSTLLNTPSKLTFVSKGALYLSDDRGKTIEKVAVINRNCEARIFGVSPSSKWVILNISPKDARIISEQFLYAVNIEMLELIKITEDDWEGGFEVSFELGEDRLIYGFQGVNAPFCSIAAFDLNTKENSYLLDCSKNSVERAYKFDISLDGKYMAYAGGNVEVFPDNRTALYLKNLETGELKMLVKPSNLDPNMGGDFISSAYFINGKKEVLYSEEIWKNSSTYNPVTKYFVVDFEGHAKEITEDDAFKLLANNRLIEEKLKRVLNKNLHVNALLEKCNKIVFTVFGDDNSEKLFLCDNNLSNIQDTGISDPNDINFSYGCKFVCETLTHSQTSEAPKSTWYLIDAQTSTKVNLGDVLKMDINSAIYIGK